MNGAADRPEKAKLEDDELKHLKIKTYPNPNPNPTIKGKASKTKSLLHETFPNVI